MVARFAAWLRWRWDDWGLRYASYRTDRQLRAQSAKARRSGAAFQQLDSKRAVFAVRDVEARRMLRQEYLRQSKAPRERVGMRWWR